MADINLIKTDIEKENEGVWVPFAAGIELKIARARNPKYQEMLRNLCEGIRLELRKDSIDKDKLDDILLKVRAKTVLVGWRNIEEGGKEVSYSPEKAEEYFRDKELKDFYVFVIAVSENSDQYRKVLTEDSEKNS